MTIVSYEQVACTIPRPVYGPTDDHVVQVQWYFGHQHPEFYVVHCPSTQKKSMITVKTTSTVRMELDGQTAEGLVASLEWVLHLVPQGYTGPIRLLGHGNTIEEFVLALKQGLKNR